MSAQQLPTYIDPELWAGFLESRKAMKVPFTDFAKKLTLKKLMGMYENGWCPNSALEKSITHGYRGVFETGRRDAGQKMIGQSQHTYLESFKERDTRIARQSWEEMTGQKHPGDSHSNIIDVVGSAQLFLEVQ